MRWIPLPTAVVTFLLASLPVLAQDASPNNKQVVQPWVTILVAFFILLFIAFASFLSSKRGHQD